MLRRNGFVVVLVAIFALVAFQISPAFAHHKSDHDKGGGSVQEADHEASDHDGDAGNEERAYTEADDGDADDNTDPNVDEDDNAHPSGKDRSVENGGSGVQGHSESNPDDSKGPRRYEGELGDDKPAGPGGTDPADQDGNNGCGNDDDFDDDNNGWCGKPQEDDTQVQGSTSEICAEVMSTGEICDDTVEEVQGTVQGTATTECVDDMATAEDECGDDTVLGKIINQAVPKAAPATVAATGVSAAPASPAAILPFTGAELLPVALTGLGLVGTGAALARRKR